MGHNGSYVMRTLPLCGGNINFRAYSATPPGYFVK